MFLAHSKTEDRMRMGSPNLAPWPYPSYVCGRVGGISFHPPVCARIYRWICFLPFFYSSWRNGRPLHGRVRCLSLSLPPPTITRHYNAHAHCLLPQSLAFLGSRCNLLLSHIPCSLFSPLVFVSDQSWVIIRVSGPAVSVLLTCFLFLPFLFSQPLMFSMRNS